MSSPPVSSRPPSEILPLRQAAARLGESLGPLVHRAARRLPLRFPAEYFSLIDPDDPLDPLRKIAWPDAEELEVDPGALEDPVGEGPGRPHPLLIRKYRDRVLLLVTRRCHFYCRFCFRAGEGAEPGEAALAGALETLAGLEGVREVILSGGDPLVLGDQRLGGLLEALGRIPELRVLRLHTRAPIHQPGRITRQLADLLAGTRLGPVWTVVHATHCRELREASDRALGLLARAGVPLLAQSVLLAGVNDDPGVLAELFRGLYERGIRPYYLHHPDRVAGTRRFRLPIARGLEIVRRLRDALPGPAMPTYVIDPPDGRGKVPVSWLEPAGPGRWRIPRPDGQVVFYEEESSP